MDCIQLIRVSSITTELNKIASDFQGAGRDDIALAICQISDRMEKKAFLDRFFKPDYKKLTKILQQAGISKPHDLVVTNEGNVNVLIETPSPVKKDVLKSLLERTFPKDKYKYLVFGKPQKAPAKNPAKKIVKKPAGPVTTVIPPVGKGKGKEMTLTEYSVKKAPAVKAPAVKAPAVKAPAVKAPAVKAPAVKAPAVKAPAVKAPAVKAPAVKAPAVKAPAAKPAVKAPAVKTPAVKTPAVKAPAAKPKRKKAPAPALQSAEEFEYKQAAARRIITAFRWPWQKPVPEKAEVGKKPSVVEKTPAEAEKLQEPSRKNGVPLEKAPIDSKQKGLLLLEVVPLKKEDRFQFKL